jgi:flagellar hook-basal body complex protein FliE
MIPPISGAVGPLGPSEWKIPGVGSLGQVDPNAQIGAGDATGATSGSSGSFGSALSSAIGSLESSQATATTASQQLATGQLSDPAKAVTAVENASLEMDFASQIQSKLVEAAQNIFSTTM